MMYGVGANSSCGKDEEDKKKKPIVITYQVRIFPDKETIPFPKPLRVDEFQNYSDFRNAPVPILHVK